MCDLFVTLSLVETIIDIDMQSATTRRSDRYETTVIYFGAVRRRSKFVIHVADNLGSIQYTLLNLVIG